MELAPEKQQLHAHQHEERAALLAALDSLEADYHKEVESCRRQVRKKKFTHAITRARRYHEEKSVWEYVNNLVEDIHLFTWQKTVMGACTTKYQQERQLLERDLRDLDAEHRKERIILRYAHPPRQEETESTMPSPNPHLF